MTVLLIVAGVVVAPLVVIGLLGRLKVERRREEVADILERFVSGTGSDYEWDDFISVRIRNPELAAISRRCGGLPEEFPAEVPGTYTNAEGIAVIQEYIRALRQDPPIRQIDETSETTS